jgi:hypothetical protein
MRVESGYVTESRGSSSGWDIPEDLELSPSGDTVTSILSYIGEGELFSRISCFSSLAYCFYRQPGWLGTRL